ncbi:MAG: hypothetical protein ACNS60_13520 [Candidatus Cyclobacteriaceae bacterium M2_1C_046]
MRNFKFYLIVIFCWIAFTGCEKNDPIEELSETGNFAANIYFVPLSPIAFVGTDIETEVEYWSKGDDFLSIDFLHSIFLLDQLKLELKDVNYSYQYEDTRDKVEEEVYRSLQHNFTNFVPAKNAYVIRPTYEIPQEYKKITYKKNNSSLTVLNSSIPDEAKEDFFEVISTGLSKSQLQLLLVEVHQIVTQATFDSYYQENNLTESGKASIESHLMSIGIPALVKDNFSYEVSHRIALSFRIVNIFEEVSESTTRAFNVN